MRLPATLCVPAGVSHAPIAVLVHGSGALDRDETIYNNKPFAELAHGLARRGIATLRYDKRTWVYPDMGDITIRDEVIDDALSAITMASQFSQESEVFLIGHSLGAMMAPWVATLAKQLGGIIMMAAPARPLSDVIAEQVDYLMPSGASQSYKDEQIAAIKRQKPQYFEGEITRYRQLNTAQSLQIPILVMQGERDYQVRMTDYRLWVTALSSNSRARFCSYPGLNHLFHESHSPGILSTPADYLEQGTIPDQVIDDIANFINAATH